MAANKKMLYVFSFVFILILLFSTTNIIKADNISLEKAIEIGLENSTEIKDAENNIEQLKRNIGVIKAQKDWKIDLESNYSHIFEEDDSSQNLSLENNANSSISKDSISISANKLYNFGLSFNPTLTITEDEESLSLGLNQQLYPITNSELENQLFNNEKELIKAKEKLKNIKASKLITWIQNYLNIVRMEERKDIYIESVKKAEDNLKKVKKEKEIGEAGEQQLLTARYSLEDAKYKLKEQKLNLNESKNSFKNDLGINEDLNIEFKNENELIENLKEKTNKLTTEYLENENLMKLVEENNTSLKTNEIDRKILKRELENLKKKDDLNIKVSGDYDTKSENITAAINFSYNIYDGGKHEIDVKSKKSSIKNNISNYKDKYQQLKLDLESHLNKLALNKDRIAKQKLNYKRIKNDLDIAKIKFERGTIDYLEYQEKWITTKEAEINLKSIEDTVFINKLKFIVFVNSENLTGGF